ncbi:MAG TPA: methyltransferase domain-containing protein [Ignavibacteriales bacterium]|nr:methyltransferase domain-containing protein [Ignavibacteriales bacterium]
MFLKRSYRKEIIDDVSISDERLHRALYELNIINLLLGGNSVSRAGLSAVTKHSSSDKVRILDVGSGGSDLFFNLKVHGRTAETVSTDMNLEACRYIKQQHPGAKAVCCNAMWLPFKPESFDAVHFSLFFHHFKENDMAEILNCAKEVAACGIVINDLRRSVFALWGIKILTLLFSRSRMIRNDAPLSVKRGFIKSELKRILSFVNGCSFTIRRKWAFRWLVYCTKK